MADRLAAYIGVANQGGAAPSESDNNLIGCTPNGGTFSRSANPYHPMSALL
jgi:hypothetical protein